MVGRNRGGPISSADYALMPPTGGSPTPTRGKFRRSTQLIEHRFGELGSAAVAIHSVYSGPDLPGAS